MRYLLYLRNAELPIRLYHFVVTRHTAVVVAGVVPASLPRLNTSPSAHPSLCSRAEKFLPSEQGIFVREQEICKGFSSQARTPGKLGARLEETLLGLRPAPPHMHSFGCAPRAAARGPEAYPDFASKLFFARTQFNSHLVSPALRAVAGRVPILVVILDATIAIRQAAIALQRAGATTMCRVGCDASQAPQVLDISRL